MGLMINFLNQMYMVEALVVDPLSAEFPMDFLQQASRYHKLGLVFLNLTWITVFAVKFSFLVFFRSLVDRIRTLRIYWWVVTVATGFAWAFTLGAVFLPCPWFEDTACMFSTFIHPCHILSCKYWAFCPLFTSRSSSFANVG